MKHTYLHTYIRVHIRYQHNYFIPDVHECRGGQAYQGSTGFGGGNTTNRGGGGNYNEGGGSGVVIVSYPEAYPLAVVTGSPTPTITTVNGNRVYQFTADGSFSLLLPCYNGTYYDLDSDSCIDCLPGEYQDRNGEGSCKPCPVR